MPKPLRRQKPTKYSKLLPYLDSKVDGNYDFAIKMAHLNAMIELWAVKFEESTLSKRQYHTLRYSMYMKIY